MSFSIAYALAYVMDLFFGDPYWLPHPVRFIGKEITLLERVLYHKKGQYLGGVLLSLLTVATSFLVSYVLAWNDYLMIFFLYTTLATTSLAKEGRKVARLLKEGDLEKAKKELSYLVSRDTGEMPEEKILMSTLETIAENTVDGVIAPMFYAFVGSFFGLALPFAMGYKAINTLDSMIGYKNERYLFFGRFAAKVDDVANFIPARLAGAFLVPLAAFFLGYDAKAAFFYYWRDGAKHASPNSGRVEAAYAGALGIQFGGKISYFGKDYEKEKIGEKKKDFSVSVLEEGLRLLYATSFISFLLVIGGSYGCTWW